MSAPDFDPLTCPIIPGDYGGPHGAIPAPAAAPRDALLMRVAEAVTDRCLIDVRSARNRALPDLDLAAIVAKCREES